MPEAQAFAEAYTLTHYKTPQASFTLSTEKTDVVLFAGRSYAIITAHNPRSEAFSKEENDKRHQMLKSYLQEKKYEVDSSLGQSPDGSWSEEGFVIFDIELASALDIGRTFEQHAILYGEGNRVALAWCESEKLDWLYPKLLSDNFS
jgi:Protein of unknown function (DUF3293)